VNKTELIEQMAQDADISKAAAGQALDAMLAGITGALKGKDGKVASLLDDQLTSRQLWVKKNDLTSSD